MQDPLIGCQLANYRIDRLIGRGGMAQVYYGWDVNLERPVAIKVIDARYRSNRAYAKRFVREAQAVAAWRHENITHIYYADEQEGLYYFAMEYIDGMDLSTLLSQYASEGELMPYEDVLRIGRAVASALDYAHEQGVIHRDVKPANVLVAGVVDKTSGTTKPPGPTKEGGRVVLTDFGLALDVAQGSMGEVFGSAHYIAPEQARSSSDAVPQSDQYSLGVMLYEMLTGVVPFDDPSPTSVALQHIIAVLPPPREINPDLNLETEAVLHKALAKTPKQRYPNCGALIDALAIVLQDPVPAKAVEPPLAGLPSPERRTLSQSSVDEKVASHLISQAEQTPSAPTPLPDSTQVATDDMIGQQLDEYRIDALLGQGGMARIYHGLDVQLDRHVAIKVIDVPFRADSDYVKRFEREAQAIAQLEHPNIVRLYRYGQVDGLLYMAMQYIEGQDLHSALADYGRQPALMPAEESIRIIRQVCLALDYAHGKGVIHRDVKPSNIMLDPGGQVFLTDFGLAMLDKVETRGEIFGSPHYIAPEQAISSAGAVPQSDLYAVGIILYEMFTGERPFEAEEPLGLALQHITATPHPPRARRPEISPQVEAVILKALAKKPQERYPNGAALVDALEAAWRGAPLPVQALADTPQSLGQRKLPPLSLAAEGVSLARPAQTPAPPDEEPTAVRRPLPPVPAAVAGPSPRPARPRRAPTRPIVAPGTVSDRRRGRIVWAIGAGLIAVVVLTALLLHGQGWLPTTPWSRPTVTISPEATSPPAAATSAPTSAPTNVATSVATAVSTLDRATPAIVPATPSAGQEPRPTATATLRHTATPTPPPARPLVYELLLVKREDESMFLVNQSTAAFPLAPLRLGEDKGSIQGSEWAITQLASHGCVAVWNDKGKPKPPESLEDCEPVGERLTREGKEVFWKDEFDVYYAGGLVGTCFEKKGDECTIRITVRGQSVFLPLAIKTKWQQER